MGKNDNISEKENIPLKEEDMLEKNLNSFQKLKSEISSCHQEIVNLRKEIEKLKELIDSKNIKNKNDKNNNEQNDNQNKNDIINNFTTKELILPSKSNNININKGNLKRSLKNKKNAKKNKEKRKEQIKEQIKLLKKVLFI